MGQRGPKGAPTNLRVLRGDRKDRISTDEPTVPEGLPEAPDYMSDEARAIWDYTVAQLSVMRLASPADRDALVCYCEAVVTHRKASRLLARSNVLVTVTLRTGKVAVRNPVVQVQRDAAATIRVFAREFGLTPSGRSDIHMGGAGSNDAGAERLLS